MKKVAFLLPDLECGGAQRVILNYARHVASEGINVELVVADARGPLYKFVAPSVKLVDLNIRLGRFGKLGFAISLLFKLRNYLITQQPTNLITTLTGTNIIGVFAKKIFKFQSIHLTVRIAIFNKNKTLQNRLIYRYVYSHADLVWSLTDTVSFEARSVGKIPTSKLVTIANPIDSSFLSNLGKISVDLPDSFLNVPLIISVGRLIPQKNLGLLLNSFKLVLNNRQCRLLIVGDGTEREKLEKLAIELGISEFTLFVGHQENPWKWMKSASVYVSSSLWEGLPNSLLEALELKVPTVVTRYDESVESLAKKYDFLTSSTNSHEELARQIMRQIDDPLIPNFTSNTYESATEKLIQKIS